MAEMNWGKERDKQQFTIYPTGTYKVRIISFEHTIANNEKQTPQIRWKAEIIEPDEYRGKTILEHTALTEAALWRTFNFINACNIDTSNLPNMDTEGVAFNKVLNACRERTMYWYIREELSNRGNPRNVVDNYKADPDQEISTVDIEEDW